MLVKKHELQLHVQSISQGIRKGWFSNTSFTTGLKTLPTFRPDALVFFRAKMGRDGEEGNSHCQISNDITLHNESKVIA